ncbi:clathrin interactor EPSIN 2-like isoform X2 [Homarus americanus]|uniref:clathrin interactor EPSIN 2-like isoform X2 n=1 Tax=Homarus americanus TaxID=6706 RepID=UPI001C451258|nr:clathrin interactor EPSIN 2-like isoform X2 [Homarus americanus]
MSDLTQLLLQRGIGAILSSMGGGKLKGGQAAELKKTPPKVNAAKPKPAPQERQGFDVSSTAEFTGWGDLKPEPPASVDADDKKNATEPTKVKEELKEEKDNVAGEKNKYYNQQAAPLHRGVGTLLSNLGSLKNLNGGNKQQQPQQQQQPNKINRNNRQIQKEVMGFDLNLGSEFSGWGDISENRGANMPPGATGANMPLGATGANMEPVKLHPMMNQRRNNYNRENANTGKGPQQRNRGFQQNSLMGEYPVPGMAANNTPWGTQPPRDGSTDRGFKRDAPEGLDRENKRHRQDGDFNVKEMTKWSDTLEYNDDEESVYIADENRRLAEEYGSFVTVKILKDQGGKMGYYCELCFAEMNAKKSLELHCGGMKHLKKKNLWEKMKGKPGNGSLGGMVKPGLELGPPSAEGLRPLPGRLLPPAAFREDSNKGPQERDRSGRHEHDHLESQKHDHFGCQRQNFPEYQNRNYPGRQEGNFPGGQNHDYKRQEFQGCEEKMNQNEQKGYSRRAEPLIRSEVNFSRPPPMVAPLPMLAPPQMVAPPPTFAPPPMLAPPPMFAPPREHLSGETAGPLLKKLAESAVIHQDDANVATDVISMLLESLKEFHEKHRTPSTVHLISEAELKFNIVVELEKAAQLGRANSNRGHPHNKPDMRDKSNKSELVDSSKGESDSAQESLPNTNSKKSESPQSYGSAAHSYNPTSKSDISAAPDYTSPTKNYGSATLSPASATPSYTSSPPDYSTAPPNYNPAAQGYSSAASYSSTGYNSAPHGYNPAAAGYSAAPPNFNPAMHTFNPAAGFFNYPPGSGQSLFSAPPPPPPPPATSLSTFGYNQ